MAAIDGGFSDAPDTVPVAHSSSEPLLVTHAVRILGRANPGDIHKFCGVEGVVATDILRSLAASGMTDYQTKAPMQGWLLTSSGREHHQDLLRADVDASGCERELHHFYRAFLDLNDSFKQLCTDWQLRCGAGDEVEVNDHLDKVYDDGVVDRVSELHHALRPGLHALSSCYTRFASYGASLGRALERLASGDKSAMARPLSHSYHDVWMWLHQDLLLSLDRVRGEADGS